MRASSVAKIYSYANFGIYKNLAVNLSIFICKFILQQIRVIFGRKINLLRRKSDLVTRNNFYAHKISTFFSTYAQEASKLGLRVRTIHVPILAKQKAVTSVLQAEPGNTVFTKPRSRYLPQARLCSRFPLEVLYHANSVTLRLLGYGYADHYVSASPRFLKETSGSLLKIGNRQSYRTGHTCTVRYISTCPITVRYGTCTAVLVLNEKKTEAVTYSVLS